MDVDSTVKTRILFLESNPHGTSEELCKVEKALSDTRFRDDVELAAIHDVSPRRLHRIIRQGKPTILHITGPGLPASMVWPFQLNDVMLVDLNGASSADLRSFGRDVPVVIAATWHFWEAFYNTLGNGHSIADAFKDGEDTTALYGLSSPPPISLGDLSSVLIPPQANLSLRSYLHRLKHEEV
jgi:hypothetical protein